MKRLTALLALLVLTAGLVPATLAQGPVGETPVPQTGGEVTSTAPDTGIESLSGSFVVFDPSVGGDTCYTPGTTQTFCFRAESFTNDYEYVYNLWQRFPADWTVTNVSVQGTPACTSGSWGTFGWSFLTSPYEVNIAHTRFQQTVDHCTAYYCFDVTSGAGTADAMESWYWDGDGYGGTPHNPCSNDNYTPSGQNACDEAVQPQAAIPPCALPPLLLTPEFVEGSGCACEPQFHEFTLMNNAGYDMLVDLTYTVVAGDGECFGPEQLFVTDTASVSFAALIDPEGTPGDTVACEVYAVDSSNPANNDMSMLIKHLIQRFFDPAGWQLEPITDATVHQWAGGAVGTNPAAAGPVGYVAGGLATASILNPDLQMYDPGTGTWTQLADLPNPRFSPATGWIGGKLYLVGGFDAAFAATNDLQVYDPVANAWDNTTYADMPTARGGGVGGVGLCSSGAGPCLFHVGGGQDSSFASSTLETWQYDPGTNAWTQLDNKPAGSSANGFLLGAGVACGGYVYAGGDYRGYHEFYRLDATQPSGSQWLQMADIPTMAGTMTPAMVCKEEWGMLLLIGGDPDGYWGTYNTTVYAYNMAGDVWSAALPQQLNVGQLGSVGWHLGNKVWTVGGTVGTGPISPMPFESLRQIVCDPLFCADLEPFKIAPPAARVGEVITYTVVISSSVIRPGMHMVDPLPPGVAYAGHLNWTAGEAWYSPTANAVFWTMLPPPDAAPRPDSPDVPTIYLPEAVADRAGGAEPVGAAPTAPAAGWSYPEAVLWDNGPLVTDPGACGGMDASRLQTSLGMNTLGFGHQAASGYRMADQFTVDAPLGWNIDQITFFAYQTNAPVSPSPITAVYYQIWNGPPWAGGTVVYGDLTTNRLLSSASPNLQRDSGTTPCANNRYIFADVAAAGVTLPPGTYWLDWMTDGSLTSGPWAPPVTILGQTTTGDGYQYTTAWNPANDSGTLTQQGLPFVIEGTPVQPPTISFQVTVTAPCNTMVVNQGIAMLDWVTATFAAATHIWGEGDIEVTAPPLFAELCPDALQSSTFSICNTGDCPIDWELHEMTPTRALAGSADLPPAGRLGAGPPPDLAVTSSAPDAGSAQPVPPSDPAAVLWDQPLGSNTGAYADQDFEATFDGYDIFVADDFANAEGWRIETIFVSGNTWNAGGDLTCANTLHWQLYADDGGVPDGDPWSGGALWSLALPPGDPQVTLSTGVGGFLSDVTLNLAAPLDLPPGTYWLVFYPQLDFATCFQYGRHTSDTTNGNAAQVINPGGGFGFPTVWTSVQDPSTWALPQQDLAFRLEGAVIIPYPDFPWVREAPLSGTLLPGDCAVVDVTLDAAGLLPGDYLADLLVLSNDVDEPQITLPVTLTVLEPVSGTAIAYAPFDPVAGEAVHFTATASAASDWQWNFGDGGTASGQYATHAYATAGSYTVELIASNSCGPQIVTATVTVLEGCTAPSDVDFTWSPLSPILGEATHFSATVGAGTAPFHYAWDFGDGSGSTGSPNVGYLYATAGTFTVTLTVTNTCGTATAAHPLVVQPAVVVTYKIYLPIIVKTGMGR